MNRDINPIIFDKIIVPYFPSYTRIYMEEGFVGVIKAIFNL